MANSMVPVPPGKAGAGIGNVPDSIVKSGTQIRGFGGGSAHESVVATSENRRITDDLASGGKQAKIDGFSGNGTKGGMV